MGIRIGSDTLAGMVGVSSDDRGDLALAPYYTVRGDWVTGLHIVNTSERTQVVKLRFRRATDGLNALDFNVVLSPRDVYAGFLSDEADGAGTMTGTTTRTVKQGVEDNATTWQRANGASMNAVIQAGGRNTYEDSGNVLKVSYFIRDNATGIEFGDNAVHIRNFLDAPAITNQQYSLLSGDLNGFDFPDLNGGVPLSSGGASGEGATAGPDPIQRGRFDALRASDALGVSRIVNEWSANPAGGVAMNWVVTLPGQYTMFRLPQYAAGLTGPGRPAPGVDAAGKLTPATVCPRQAIAARGGAAPVAECDYRDLPVALAFTAYSREQRSSVAAPTAELVVSPGLAGTTPRTYLPKVANVIGFSGGSGADSAFGPVDARVTADLGQPYGWLSARVSSRDADVQVCDWDRAEDNGGVSGAGFPGAAAGRALTVTCTAVTNKGVPVIGFAAWSRRVAANPEASYGRIVEHSVPAPAAAAPTTTTTKTKTTTRPIPSLTTPLSP